MFRKSAFAAIMLLTGVSAILPCRAQTQHGPVIACATRRQSKGNTPVIMDLVVMNADGSNRKTIWSIQGNIAAINNPVWSPDLDNSMSGYQGRIACESAVVPMVMWTIRIDIDDAGAVTYLGTPEAIDLPTDLHLSGGPPAWSPDGRWIAFRGYREVGPSPYENGIYAVPCPGSTYPMSIVHVADPPDSISMGVSVSWDPSSTYVTYNQDGSIVKQQVVQVVDGVPNLIPLDSAYQPAVLVTNVANSYDGPVWSSSSVLAFCHDVTSGKKTVSYLYTVPADTTTIDVSGLSYISGTSGAGHPAWSPGGAFVIYTNGRGIVRLDMATRTQILFGSSNDAWPNWRP